MSNLPSLFVDKPTWELLREQASSFCKSPLMPSDLYGQPESVLIVMLKGRELGIPPMQAISHIHIIKGKPTISAELMLAMIYERRSDAVIQFKTLTIDGCTILAARSKEHPLTEFSFTIDDAKRAGLIPGKDNWKNYPKAMCKARAIADMARTIFPDVLMGCSYTREELDPTIPYLDVEVVEKKDLEMPEKKPTEREAMITEIELLSYVIEDESKRKWIEENVNKLSMEKLVDLKGKIQALVKDQPIPTANENLGDTDGQ